MAYVDHLVVWELKSC